MAFENTKPDAIAWIHGSETHPELFGRTTFFHMPIGGLLISTEIYGLPQNSSFFGMHLHEFGNCTPPFEQTGNHYNPKNTAHPNHAGDMPPLLNNNGYAYLTFYTNRLTIEEILGKSIIIHSQRDDFTSQPSGDAGTKIACGVIKSQY